MRRLAVGGNGVVVPETAFVKPNCLIDLRLLFVKKENMAPFALKSYQTKRVKVVPVSGEGVLVVIADQGDTGVATVVFYIKFIFH